MGNNRYGQLGDGTTTNRLVPVQIATGVIAATTRSGHSLFVKSDGTLWAMGDNSYGQLGDGATTSQSVPVQVATSVIAAAAGGSHSLFVKSDGTLWAVGSNRFGQLGDGTTTDRGTPVQVATGVIAAAAGSNHSLFVKSDGTLWTMGYNGDGQLCDGTATLIQSEPVQVASDVVAAIAGSNHSLFVKNDATLWGAGYNAYGTLGVATVEHQKPAQVTTDVIAAAGGAWHSLLVKRDGTLWGMGGTGNSEFGTRAIARIPAYIVGGYAPAITMQPDSRTANAGQGATFAIATTGAPPPALQWQSWQFTFNGSTWANLSNTGPYTGVTTGTLVIAETSPATSNSGNTAEFDGMYFFISATTPALNGAQYRCIVTHPLGSITSNTAILTVNYVPKVTTQPANQFVGAGASATFTITDVGNTTPAYQWQSAPSGSSAWTNINSATSATLTIDNASTTMDRTQYRCLVANSAGSTTSNAATLYVFSDSVTAAAQQLKIQLEASGTATIPVTGVIDLALAGGATVTSAKTITGEDAASTITGGLTIATSASNTIILGVNFTGATLDINGANDVTVTNCTFTDTPVSITNGADNTAFAWNKFTATGATGGGSAMRIDNAGSTINTLLQNNHWAGGLLSDMPAVTNARVLMFNNYFTATGNTTATIAGAGAQILSQNNIYQNTHNPLLKQNGGLLCALDNFMAATTGTTAPGKDTVFVPIYSHIMLPAGIDTPGAPTLANLITAHAGNTDGKNSIAPSSLANATLRVSTTVPCDIWPGGGWTGGSVGGSVITIGGGGTTQSQPIVTSTNVLLGGNLTLTANATDPAFNFAAWQWHHNNFAITDATSATYTIASATPTDAGAYSVTLTTTTGEIVTSGALIVTVDAYGITTHPASQTVNAGGNVTFTVVAIGANLTYQWRKNDVNISGATNASLTISNARQTDGAIYTVIVSTPAGSVTSNMAALTVNTGGSGQTGNSNDSGSTGGGGGAPSLWYLVAIVCFAAMRLIKHNRHRS